MNFLKKKNARNLYLSALYNASLENVLQFCAHLLNFSWVNSHFCPPMCNLLTNVSLKDENTKFSSWKYKKSDKYILLLTFVRHH